MRCNVCGADNLEGAVYCEDCGARLPVAAAPVTQEAPAISSAPPLPPPPVPAPAPEMAAAPPPPPPIPAPEQPAMPMPDAAPAPSAGGGILVCPACAAQNPPGVAFCEDCGASLSDTPATVASAAVAPPVNYDAPVQHQAPVGQPIGAGGSRARLILTSGREFPMEKDTILMGRRSPVDGIFPEVDLTDHDTDSYISRRHGRITKQETGWVFEDLGSSNGSWVNGAKLQPHIQQPLKEGDSLRLGKTEMVVRLS